MLETVFHDDPRAFMMLATSSQFLGNDPGMEVGMLAGTALIVFGGIKFFQWFLSGPVKPDPWGAEVAAELDSDAATPVCVRCLTPHNHMVDFCEQCGATVGPYANLSPYTYLFSVGYVLRLGTSGRFKKSVWMVAGFLLFSLATNAVLLPFVYWAVFINNLDRRREPILMGGATAEKSVDEAEP